MTHSKPGRRFLPFLISAFLVCALMPSLKASAADTSGDTAKIVTAFATQYLKAKTSTTLPVALYKGSAASSEKLTFKSGNKKVASVNSKGKVTAKKKGTTTITISAKGAKSVKVKIKVVAKQKKVKSVSLAGAPASIEAGQSVRLKAAPKPANATNTNLKFTSSDTNVLTIDKAGMLTARKAGVATVTVKAGAKSFKKAVRVTAKAAPTPPAPPAPPVAGKELSAAPYGVKLALSPSSAAPYTANYVVVSAPRGVSSYTFKLGGKAAAATPVLADNTLIKIPAPAGAKTATVTAEYGGKQVFTKSVNFATAGKAPAQRVYGTVPMTFSEYFHDVTAEKSLPVKTAFAADGTVDTPKKFVTQGTRTGAVIGGVQTKTYAEAEAMGLPQVDAVSSATYGDTVHFPPNGNLALTGGNRMEKTNPDSAINGIKRAEISIAYDLYANADILKQAGRATAQSKNVLAKLTRTNFTLKNIELAGKAWLNASGNTATSPDIYKAKPMLTDGNFGVRALVNNAAAANLPGAGNGGDAESVTYGGNWGDIMVGFSFGDATALGPEYSGAGYWDNFANNIYAGVITDSKGHSEPLVFMQNLFTHRMHTDFDVALSPSRFARLKNLNYPDTYNVRVFTDGFKDVEFSFSAKKFENASAALAAPVTISTKAADSYVVVQGIENPAAYAASAKLYLGNSTSGTAVSTANYTIAPKGSDRVLVTLKPGALSGVWWGTTTNSTRTFGLGLYAPESASAVTKPIGLALTYGFAPSLSLTDGGTGITNGATPTPSNTGTTTAALSVAKSNGTLYILDDDLAKNLSDTTSTIRLLSATAATPVGDVLARPGGAGTPWVINLSSAQFSIGNTYVLTLNASANAANCTAKTYYINIT